MALGVLVFVRLEQLVVVVELPNFFAEMVRYYHYFELESWQTSMEVHFRFWTTQWVELWGQKIVRVV